MSSHLKNSRNRVIRKFPKAYCKKLSEPIEGNKWIIWPGGTMERGVLNPAIGIGKTAVLAWKSVKL